MHRLVSLCVRFRESFAKEERHGRGQGTLWMLPLPDGLSQLLLLIPRLDEARSPFVDLALEELVSLRQRLYSPYSGVLSSPTASLLSGSASCNRATQRAAVFYLGEKRREPNRFRFKKYRLDKAKRHRLCATTSQLVLGPTAMHNISSCFRRRETEGLTSRST